MALAPSTRLGPYEIISAIGAGGMGEVYRARDTRLERVVAIKILPSHLSSNPQARERFDREAKAISSLSHPHICQLYDVGHQDGVDFLVMEYLEGETLAGKLRKGPLPLEQVLRYAVQITGALDAAHRHGVIHRDLKPGNIILTKTGAKIVDFGLAKMHAAEAVSGVTAMVTQTTPLTGEGAILGTLQYMAPEQLEGGDADARTDIFALGAVIYEMATGRRAFEGKSQASLISAIMSAEPPALSSLQSMTPPLLDHVVRTCMAKDPDARWQTAHDILIELNWIAQSGAQPDAAKPSTAIRTKKDVVPWAIAGVTGLAAVILVFLHFGRTPAPVHPVRFQTEVPENVTLGWNDTPVVSPDGQRFVFSGLNTDGNSQLWLRALDSTEIRSVPGTEGATLPFWSPDSRSVAFFSQSKLKKTDLSGTPVEVLASTDDFPGGGSWSASAGIIFSNRNRLEQISSEGGAETRTVALDPAVRAIIAEWPQFLPDGRHYLVHLVSSDTGKNGIYVCSLDSRECRLLVSTDANPAYAAPGFVVYGRGDTLMAQAFHPNDLRVSGEPFSVAEHVGAMSFRTGRMFSVSQTGVLVYRRADSGIVQLAWYSRDGRRLGPVGEPGPYGIIRLSPDERRLAMERLDPQIRTHDIWTLELASGILTRQTFHPTDDTDPVWSPDSRELVFTSNPNGTDDLFQKLLGGSDEHLLLGATPYQKYPKFWLRDGKSILFLDTNGKEFYQLPLAGERKPVLLSKSEFTRDNPVLSPDEHWIAYNSLESGRWEVYIASFPAFDEKRQVSVSGGCQPLWRKDGKELFYRTLEGRMMAAEVKNGTVLQTGVPQALFQTRGRLNPIQSEYCVTGDGKRFLFREPVGESAAPITVVLNWQAGLKK